MGYRSSASFISVLRSANTLGRGLKEARKNQGFTLLELSFRLEDLGVDVQYKTLSKWELGACVPNAYQFIALCKALDIPDALEYFTCSMEEELNEDGRRKLTEYRKDLIASGKYIPTSSYGRIIEMQVSSLCVSAGTGEFLDDGNFDLISVPAYTVPKGAQFGVWVAGDSMEPVFHDGQIVWIEPCEHLRKGEIGIMLYDNCGYLKMYDEQVPEDPEAYTDMNGVVHPQAVMVSCNKKYSPIVAKPELTFEIVGRVLRNT